VKQFLSKPFHPAELLCRIVDELSCAPRPRSIERAHSAHVVPAGRAVPSEPTLRYPGKDAPLRLE
jgi:hypothetical protein